MLKLTLSAAVVALNLSYAPVEGLIQNAHGSKITRMAYNNPFSGARSIDLVLTPTSFNTRKASVPYYEFWNNRLGQTAQQMVAICAMLQQEFGLSCDNRLIDLGTRR